MSPTTSIGRAPINSLPMRKLCCGSYHPGGGDHLQDRYALRQFVPESRLPRQVVTLRWRMTGEGARCFHRRPPGKGDELRLVVAVLTHHPHCQCHSSKGEQPPSSPPGCANGRQLALAWHGSASRGPASAIEIPHWHTPSFARTFAATNVFAARGETRRCTCSDAEGLTHSRGWSPCPRSPKRRAEPTTLTRCTP